MLCKAQYREESRAQCQGGLLLATKRQMHSLLAALVTSPMLLASDCQAATVAQQLQSNISRSGQSGEDEPSTEITQKVGHPSRQTVCRAFVLACMPMKAASSCSPSRGARVEQGVVKEAYPAGCRCT